MNTHAKQLQFPTAIKWAGCGILLLLSFFVLLYYITGPSLGYIHSDCTDSLLWSLASLESGSVLAEDFEYAALLPFGSSLWTVPILAIFGYSVTAYMWSMSVFVVIFILATFSLFRAMKWHLLPSAATTFALCMLLSGSEKLREIMWEHTIYYSLSILLILLLLNLCLRLIPHLDQFKYGYPDRKNNIRIILYSCLLILLCIGCATDGMQVLVISVVPALGAWIAYTLFDNKNTLLSGAALKRYALCGVMLFGVCIGLILLRIITLGGTINAGYENAYSTWSDMEEWSKNATGFLHGYLSLFGVEISSNDAMFSLSSVLDILKMLCALILLICPYLLLVRYQKIQHRSSKILLWAHLILSFVILFAFVCGTLSSANWRLTPLLGSSILATLVYVRELFGSTRVEKRIAIILAAVLICVSLLNAFAICSMPHDYGKERDHAVIAQMLEEKGYDYGYATFWNSHITTLLSDNAVRIMTVETINGNLEKYMYQHLRSWELDREGESSFLMLTQSEFEGIRFGEFWTELNARLPLIDEMEYNGYRIFVFEGNIFA